MIIEKPKGYQSHHIVYDGNAILVINLDYTMFQKHMIIGKDWQEFEAIDKGTCLEIMEVD